MDRSKVADNLGFTGAMIEHARFDGAHITRIMHPPGQHIDAHAHDWPVLALYRVGAYREIGEHGEAFFDGPSVVFHPANVTHADVIGADGLETLSMTFDPAWLAPALRAKLPTSTVWRAGGAMGVAAGRLARIWSSAGEATVRHESLQLLRGLTSARSEVARPPWGGQVVAALADDLPTEQIALRIGLNSAWLARAYRAWRGEGIGDTQRRQRVERAIPQLRLTATSLADIAAECGFCDQSHMNRSFRAVLGRTPLDVRREAPMLLPLIAAAANE